ncbi:hypothetical protein BDV12DRAFT_174430 [Aspergillus spectabilis]
MTPREYLTEALLHVLTDTLSATEPSVWISVMSCSRTAPSTPCATRPEPLYTPTARFRE